MKETFKNLKIGTKLLFFLVIVLIFYSATVVVSIASIRSMAGQMKDMYDGPFDNVQTSLELVANLQTVGRNITILSATEDVVDEDSFIEATKEIIKKEEIELETLASGYIYDEESVAELKTLFSELAVPRDRILEYIERGNDAQALELYINSYLPKAEIVKQKLETVSDACVADAQATMDSVQADNARSLIFMIVLGIIVILFTLLLWLVFTRSILGPIRSVKAAANAIARGDLDARLDYQSANELGQLAEDIRKTALALKSYVDEIRRGMRAVGSGKLNYETRLEFNGDFIALGESLNEISHLLRESIAQISSSAEQISVGAEQVSNNAQVLAQGASEQAGSVEELAVSMNDISDGIAQNADTAVSASNLAGSVGKQLLECNTDMTRLLDSVIDIKNNSEEITGIVKEIEDIAFQTNILALNASVEAARAGDAGRGFSVVAGEIRRLASKTSSASKMTADLVEKNSDAVKDGMDIVHVTARSLEASVNQAQEVSQMVDNISRLSVSQADAIAQIRKSVELISEIVQGNSATSEESAAASEELSAQAQILKELVEQFEV